MEAKKSLSREKQAELKRKRAQMKAEKKRIRKIRFAKRSVMYFLRILLYITAGALICLGVMLTCERLSNLYILTTESMALRAKCILENEAVNDLQEYFTEDVIASDTPLHEGVYSRYTVTNYNYDLKVKKIVVFPWSTSATVTVVEDCALKGNINADQLVEGQNAADYPLPEWNRAEYRLQFTRYDTRWYVTELTVTDDEPPVEVLNTPDPDLTPRPMATPTPIPAETP